MTKLIAGKRYKVEWVDICSFAEWKPKEDILKTPPILIKSVYIYIGKGKGGLCFAADFNGEEYGNISIIPKYNIKKVTKIK